MNSADSQLVENHYPIFSDSPAAQLYPTTTIVIINQKQTMNLELQYFRSKSEFQKECDECDECTGLVHNKNSQEKKFSKAKIGTDAKHNSPGSTVKTEDTIVLPGTPEHIPDYKEKENVPGLNKESTLQAVLCTDEDDQSAQQQKNVNLLFDNQNKDLGHPIQLQWNCPFEPACTEHFDTKAALNIHLLLGHDSLPYRCIVSGCTASFGSALELGHHRNTLHGAIYNFLCSKCDKSFPEFKKLYQHNVQIHCTGLFRCHYANCQLILPTRSLLNSHQHQHKATSSSSSICEKTKNPKIPKHEKVPLPATNYQCLTCKQVFSQKNSFTSHSCFYLNEQSLSCPVCGKRFIYLHSLQYHTRIHKAKLKCPNCRKVFPSESQLKRHINLSHQMK